MHHTIATCLTLASLVAFPAFSQAEVTVKQAADRSVEVQTAVYTARIDARGNLAELTVKGAKAFTHQFGDPGKPPAEPPSINVINQVVAVRSGTARVEWTFGEETIKFLTEGYNFECRLDPSVKFVAGPGGTGGELNKYGGVCTTVVLANELTITSPGGMGA